MSGPGKALILGLAGAVATPTPHALDGRVAETTYLDVAPIFYKRCGTPGDLSRLPPKPEFSEKWSFVPDAVVAMEKYYDVPATGTIDYQWFQIPTTFGEDKWIQALEILPSSPDVVHHVLMYAGPPTEEIFASSFVNGSFSIPAGAKDVAVPAEIGVSRAIRIWGLLPHTHLRGVRWRYTLRKPDGSSEVVLNVPRYDFNWQTYYQFATPLELPAGSKLESIAWYDNSASNTHNPDPSKEVRWGQQTWEEMQYTGFLYSIVRQ